MTNEAKTQEMDTDPPFPASEAEKCPECEGGGEFRDDMGAWTECPKCEGYGVQRVRKQL